MIAYADNATLVDVRTSVITSGVIPDTYLIEPTGTYWNANGGTSIKNALQQWIDGNNMTLASDRFQNSINRALYNVDILLEGRIDSKHEVTAMLVAKERLQGTYSETGYLKKYHDYVIGEYNPPSTITAIETKLNSALGDMAPLAGAIKTVTDRAASIAGVPTGLWTSDPEYWLNIELNTYCKLNNGPTCTPSIIGAQPTLFTSAAHSWRASNCVLDDTVCGGGSDGFEAILPSVDATWKFGRTVTGTAIYAIFAVQTAPPGTSILLDVDMRNYGNTKGNKAVTDSTTNGGTVGGYGLWYGYNPSHSHPCYSSSKIFEQYNDGTLTVHQCMLNHAFSFRGAASVDFPTITTPDPPDRTPDPTPDPDPTPMQHKPEITTTDPPKFGYIGHKYHYDIDATDANTGDTLTYSASIVGKGNTDGITLNDIIDSGDGNLIWAIPPEDKYIGKYDVTVKVDDGTKENNILRSDTLEFELTVRKNNIPELKITATGGIDYNIIDTPDNLNLPDFDPDVPTDASIIRVMWRFGGTLPHLGDPIHYHFYGKDSDGGDDNTDQTFILSVSEEPSIAHAVLTDCKPVSELTVYDTETNSEIIRSTDSSFNGSACIFALETDDSNLITSDFGRYNGWLIKYGQNTERFSVQLSDGVADPVSREILFSFVDPIEETEEVGKLNAKTAINIIDAVTARAGGGPVVKDVIDYFADYFGDQFRDALIEIGFDVSAVIIDNFDDNFTLIMRCEINVPLSGQTCDPLPPDVADLKELLKSIGIIGGNDVSGQQSEERKPRWTLVANVSNTRHIAVNDTNIEPNKDYTYVARIIAGDKASDYMPLGNVTTPADGPPVLILNQPNMTVLLGSPYVDPGYVAVDYYEGNVTDRVRTQTHETIDTNKEGTYWIFYYVTDSAGHQSAVQVRTVTVVAQDLLPPTITLIDGANITIPASVPYVDPGYTAIDAIDGNITGSVTVTGTVNTDVLGTYMLQYSVSDSAGNTATQSRTVIVADMTPPTITLIGGARIPTLLAAPYVDPGYEAIDNIDGNVTSSVVVTGTVDTSTNGTYILQYDVSDSVGNAAITQNRTVIVTSDMTPPVITLKGHPRIEVAAGIPYVDPGYNATDNIDGNITERVVVTGLVNTDVLHAYMLHYDVSDSAGNAAITQNRIVSVVDATPPVFTLIGGTHITVPASVPYVDPGYTSIDAIYGNVTHRVAVSGTVNTDVLGSYTLVYFPDDPSGNLADPVRRTVVVADLTPPVITLKGGSELQITKGTTYAEPGYMATDNIDGNVTSSVVVTGSVDTSTAGMYTVQYDVNDRAGNAAITQNRTITVMGDDTPPTITLKGQQAITIEGHTTYVEPGYVATDDIDGNITDMVIVTGTVNTAVLDTYTLNYDVSDSSGNAAITQNRTIIVVDTTPPVITLKGDSELQITKGTTYVEPGYNATDNIDGNITSSVVVTGTVDTNTPGMYTISYEVTDGAGNVATKVLTVTVVLDTVTPVITLSDGSSITLPVGPTFTEPGYTAIDNIDGNITSMVNVTGTVNPLIPGTYTISYAVTDSSGNTGQQTRTVTISPPTDTTQYCNNMTLAQLMTSGKYNIINKMFSSESNIKGTDGADLIIVGNNGPTIEGRDGDDCIIGGTGNDTILGQSGNDMIFGNDGDDTIRGGPGHDHLWGQNGNDIMHGGENGDTMYGGADADTMYGGPGQDTIRGGAGNDQIWGLGGNDTIYGDAGDDMLYAGPGIDTIYGGPGTDTIESGESDTVHDDE